MSHISRVLFCLLILLAGHEVPATALDSTPADTIDYACAPGLCFEDPATEQVYGNFFTQALAHYPELRNVAIRIRFANLTTTMSSRPQISVLVCSRKNREYLLTIDSLQEEQAGMFFRLSDSARYGLIGHELGHVLDYHHHRLGGVVLTGLEYLFCRARLEHRVDRIAVSHGFREYLCKYAEAAFNPAFAGHRYARFKRKYYYNPSQLAQLEVPAETIERN